jgi:hypothetical protein
MRDALISYCYLKAGGKNSDNDRLIMYLHDGLARHQVAHRNNCVRRPLESNGDRSGQENKEENCSTGIHQGRREGVTSSFESEDAVSQNYEADQKNGRFIASEGAQPRHQSRASEIMARQARQVVNADDQLGRTPNRWCRSIRRSCPIRPTNFGLVSSFRLCQCLLDFSAAVRALVDEVDLRHAPMGLDVSYVHRKS